jgi:hypothetical protein
MAPLYLLLHLVEMPSAKRITKKGGDFYHKRMPNRFEM